MKRIRIILAALAICTMSVAQKNTSPAAFPENGKTVAVRHIGPNRSVRYLKDVVYAQKDGKKLHLQILIPEGTEDKQLPCVLFVQGSGWKKQRVRINLPSLARFASRGYVVAVVQYRESAIAPFPAQVADAKTAVRFMRKYARYFNADPDKQLIWGDSSGGHTTLMVALTQDDAGVCDDSVYSDVPCRVKAAVAYYPPTDISLFNDFPDSMKKRNHDKNAEGLLLGGNAVETHQEMAKNASPIYYLRKDRPTVPILMAHGTNDNLVCYHQTEIFVEKLEEYGKEYKLFTMKGAGHGSWQFWTDDILDQIDSWVRSVIE